MKLVFFGPPGAGKGTIAKELVDILKIPQISTGDLFRFHINNKTELGLKVKSILDAGELVSDDITISIVKERINKDDCKNGYILDGFPRTIVQAKEFEKYEPIDYAIYFKITDEEVKIRLGGRRICPKCGSIYHIKNNKPKKENICDKDNEQLIIRDDDKEEAIIERLKVYHNQTEPLLEFYKSINKLIEIDATNSPDKVVLEIRDKLKI